MSNASDATDAAANEWRTALGADQVLSSADAQRYGTATTSIVRGVRVALQPRSVEDVVHILRIASKHRVPLYPSSTGRNWGYGCGSPVTDGCAVVDLSRMNRIRAIDADLGTVTVEPGVTQRDLRAYLDAHGLPFLVPVTGAGPDCSILGNALERGYGITPYADHFGALMNLEAVLPDGTVYRSALADAGGATVDRCFKWGIGPYLDGLFSQGNFGIVTQATFALARKPERTEAFFFWIDRDEDLEETVSAIRRALVSAGAVLGSINLMNSQRVLSMMVPYPRARTPVGEAISEEVIGDLARAHHVSAWSGVGTVYGTKEFARAARIALRRSIGKVAKRVVFLTPGEVRTARRWLPLLPFGLGRGFAPVLEMLDGTMQALDGIPTEVALPLAYWKMGGRPNRHVPMNPQRDGVGLIWFAPLVPMIPERVRTYVELVKRICLAHGMDPLLTMTSLSDRCFDSSVPILFDRGDAAETERALACELALLEQARSEGFLPYRVGTHRMAWLADPTHTSWRLAASLKQAIDPLGLVSPGRYSVHRPVAESNPFLTSRPGDPS